MLEIKPIESKDEQEKILSLCHIAYKESYFAYKAFEGASLLAAAMMMATLTACGGGSTSTPGATSTTNNALYTKPTSDVTLEVWYAVSGVTGETFVKQVEAYQKANPNIKINPVYAGSFFDWKAICTDRIVMAVVNGEPDATMFAVPEKLSQIFL